MKERHLNLKDRQYLRAKGWQKFFQSHGCNKQVGIAILISNKIDFKLKSIKRGGGEHFILTKGKIHQDEISILNTYAPNTEASMDVK